MTASLLRNVDPQIILTEEKLSCLVKSNISCYFNKPLSSDLINELTQQIVDSINFYIEVTKTNSFRNL